MLRRNARANLQVLREKNDQKVILFDFDGCADTLDAIVSITNRLAVVWIQTNYSEELKFKI